MAIKPIRIHGVAVIAEKVNIDVRHTQQSQQKLVLGMLRKPMTFC
jgi:hypothetical protein